MINPLTPAAIAFYVLVLACIVAANLWAKRNERLYDKWLNSLPEDERLKEIDRKKTEDFYDRNW